MKDNGVDIMKDGLPALMTGSGVGMTFNSVFTIQVIGSIVGIAGLILAYFRYRVAKEQKYETKRANDLKQEQWEHELANSKAEEKAACSGEEKERRRQTTSSSQGKKEATQAKAKAKTKA